MRERHTCAAARTSAPADATPLYAVPARVRVAADAQSDTTATARSGLGPTPPNTLLRPLVSDETTKPGGKQ